MDKAILIYHENITKDKKVENAPKERFNYEAGNIHED